MRRFESKVRTNELTTKPDRRDMIRRDALRVMGVGLGAGALAVVGRPVWAAPREPSTTAVPARSPVIRTLHGDVPPEALAAGAVLFHEHLSMRYPLGSTSSFSDDVDLMIREVRTAGSEGVAAIVDGGHPDMARSLEALRRIDREGGVSIVASGGYYMQRSYPADIHTKSSDEIAEDLVAEARRDRLGAFGEIGQERGTLTDDERKVFGAVGMASVRTGLPVFTHNAYSIRATDVPRDAGLRQLEVLESAGADPRSVCIGHVCCLDDPNVDVASEIARRGAYVGFDRVTLNATMPDERRVEMAVALIDEGHADRLLLSSDFYSARSLESRGGPGIAQTVTVFAPMLREAGVADETVRMILEENPRRFLAFEPKTG